MLARRDLITPTLGGLPWFEKPPLLYWLMIIGYRLCGVNEYAARLGPALCGLVTALFVYLIGDAINGFPGKTNTDGSPHIGQWSALVWLSSLGAIGFSRGATFDIVLTTTITGALACFFIGEAKERTAPLLVGFYLFAGLSLLAKGLIGFVIIFGVISLYFILRREWPSKILWVSLIWGVPLSFAVAGVWYGPMIARHGWTFIDQFIVQHHFARFVTNRYHHRGPIYFYLPVLIGLALPWTIVLGASLFSSRRWNWRGPLQVDRARVFALAWLVLPVIFFSFSESKLPAYILPALPAVAVLAGERISCFCRESRGGKVLRLTGALLILVAVAGIWYTHRNSDVGLTPLVLIGLPLTVIGIAAIARPQLRTQLFVAISAVAFVTTILSLEFAAPAVAKPESVKDQLAAAAERGYANTPVAELQTIERSAQFYAAGRLTYGDDGEPIRFELTSQVVDAARRNGGLILCFVPAELAPKVVRSQLANFEVLSANDRVALLVVRPK